MSDDLPKLSKREIEAGWTPESLAAYTRERNEAAANKIWNPRGNINPLTGKPRRRTIVEREDNAHSWLKRSYDPCHYWRTPRRDGDI
jgi:hypothetical protein